MSISDRMEKCDDIVLVQLISQGDRQAFKYVFDTYFTPLCRFGILYLQDSQEAEQVALDIFVRLWEERERLDIKLSFKAYLFYAMRNRCLNVLRDRKAMCPLDEALGIHTEDALSMEAEELMKLIREAIQTLPEKCREVFLKSRKEHLSYREIAENMQISVKTVEAQISKALKVIRMHLGDKYSFLF